MSAALVSTPTSPTSSRDANEAHGRRAMSHRLRRLVRRSGAAVAIFGALAVARGCWAGSPPPKSLDGLVQALGGAAHVVVRTNDFVWEASDGVVSDFAFGRRVVFLGAERPGAPRDVYRARVRLTPEGRPLEVVDVVDLTSTPFGDEQGLVRDATGEHVAFTSWAYGQLQGISVLDLRGEGRAAKGQGVVDRAMLWVSNLQETGDGDGIGRLQVVSEKEATSAQLRFDGGILVAQLTQAAGGVRVARVDVERGELVGAVDGIRVEQLAHIPKRFIHWAVDTVRAVPWIGPEPIAWLEAKVWEWKDRWRRFRYTAIAKKSGHENAVKTEAEMRVAARAIDTIKAGDAGEEGASWPPHAVPTLYKDAEPGEGAWIAVQQPWMHRITGAPPAFYRTFVRPDPLRPYSKIILVAMDTRQLDLDVEAGVEDPKPTVGSFHGTGRIPREPSIARRAVAAFNGGFKTEHGHYGMMLKKHVLLPPVPGAATAVVTDDGRFAMGAWSPTRDIPANILSYRQNLDPLIEDGIVNPRGRGSWGAVLPGQPHMSGQQTERSGVCVTKARHVLYVWGDDVGPEALAKAMQLAGCDFGMHLDMNPYHTGFVFMSFDDALLKNGKSETLTPLMAIGPRRYIDYNPKDFFYVLLRDPTPPSVAVPGHSALAWTQDEGVQPPPTWSTAIWRAVAQADGAREGVALTMIDGSRVRWLVRPGTEEHVPKGAHRPREIDGEDAKRVIAAIGLGTADAKEPLGGSQSALVVRADGTLTIVDAAQANAPMSGAIDVVQGATLITDGRAVDDTRRGGVVASRVAIGVTKDGRVVVARGHAPTEEPLVSALLDAGCVRAIAARGHSDGFVARAGTANPPMTSYAQTALYALAQPMQPRAFRFDRTADGSPIWPVVTKPVP